MKDLFAKLKTKESLKGFALFLLGALGLGFDVADQLPNLPEYAVRTLEVLQVLISAMGLREVMAQSAASIRKVLLDLKSKTFWGSLIGAVVVLVSNPDMLNLSDEWKAVFSVLSVILTALGLKDAAKRGIMSGSNQG